MPVLLCACTTTQDEYAGPALPDSAVAIVEVGATDMFARATPLAVKEIDGTEHAGGGIAYDQIVPLSTQEYRLLPGTHHFTFDAPGMKGLFADFHYQSFSVTATLEPNKRYRFVGRVEPITAKGLALGVLIGSNPVHVELVDETDGTTVKYSHEVPQLPGYHVENIAAYPNDAPVDDSGVPPPLPVPPAPLTYDRWLQQSQNIPQDAAGH